MRPRYLARLLAISPAAGDATGRRVVPVRRLATFMLATLLFAALIGSVVAPALETRRIMRALFEIRATIEPSRQLSSRLASGIAVEYSALQGYALFGDSTQLRRYQATAHEDSLHLASLGRLTTTLGPAAIREAAAVRRRIEDWRNLNGELFDSRRPRVELAAAAREQRSLRDDVIDGINRFAIRLSTETTTRLAAVSEHERRGLIVNAGLVLVSVVAIIGVAILTVRERRLAAMLRRRVQEESALRHTARALSAAATLDEAIERIVEGTVAVTHAYGAYVEFATTGDDLLTGVACIPGGEATAPARVRVERAGSLTAEAAQRHSPMLAAEVPSIEQRLPVELAAATAKCAGLVEPLSSGGQTFGVLVLLRRAGTPAFADYERRQTALLADLAAAVLWRLDTEQRALAKAQQRATYETALREAAEALAGAFTLDDVSGQIARSALQATQARGAWVEHVDGASEDARSVVVRGAAGSSASAVGIMHPYAGSHTERVIGGGAARIVDVDLLAAERSGQGSRAASDAGSTLVLPLGGADAPIGAVFIEGAAPQHFLRENAVWANTFRHLATLAYEKVKLLDEAVDGRQALERVMKSRQRLMRGFSHDVKNPLGAADGYVELLTDGLYGDLSAAQKAAMVRIRHSIHEALGLIEDLHELVRAETGNIVVRSESVDVGELARTIGEEYLGAANRSGLSLTVEAPSDLPIIESDSARVRQVVGNLVSNAIKYTKAGSVSLRVRQSPSTLPEASINGWVLFEVIDSGLGIPADQRDRIFEEFSRIGAIDRPGAGLGLAISKRVAEALGGQITVESEPRHGSTFTLRIPIRKSFDALESSVGVEMHAG